MNDYKCHLCPVFLVQMVWGNIPQKKSYLAELTGLCIVNPPKIYG